MIGLTSHNDGEHFVILIQKQPGSMQKERSKCKNQQASWKSKAAGDGYHYRVLKSKADWWAIANQVILEGYVK